MLTTPDLQTSLTFVSANVTKQPDKPAINEGTFASADEHFVLHDATLAEQLRELAMQEMGVGRFAVGDPGSFKPVEFFHCDVKKDKKAVEKVRRLLTQRWIRAIYEFEAARDDAGGNILDPQLNPFVNAVEHLVKLRRFIMEGTDPEVLKKRKRPILLFHHVASNAPQPD